MGSKHRLLSWIESSLTDVEFETVLDAFSGSGCVSYLFKTMGKSVHANDFLQFATDLATATVANSHATLDEEDVQLLLTPAPRREKFIETTFAGIFFSPTELAFLDQAWSHLPVLSAPKRSVALAALYRACLKKQPRGVFTVSGGRYDDGRRDLRLPLWEHFCESVDIFNSLVFDNGRDHHVTCGDVFAVEGPVPDLVYLDPPYVPRADDNCYVKRYHFLEGLSSYWRGAEFHPNSKVKKLRKRFTPFSYRRHANEAFATLFERFRESTIVLSYSSSGYPDLQTLVDLLRCVKRDVDVFKAEHRYHFGTHAATRGERRLVTEYLIVGV